MAEPVSAPETQIVRKNRRRHETVRSLLEGLFAMAASDIFVERVDVSHAVGGKIVTTTVRGDAGADVNRKGNKKRGPKRSRPRKPGETEAQRKKRLAAEHSADYRQREKKKKKATKKKPPKKKAKKKP